MAALCLVVAALLVRYVRRLWLTPTEDVRVRTVVALVLVGLWFLLLSGGPLLLEDAWSSRPLGLVLAALGVVLVGLGVRCCRPDQQAGANTGRVSERSTVSKPAEEVWTEPRPGRSATRLPTAGKRPPSPVEERAKRASRNPVTDPRS